MASKRTNVARADARLVHELEVRVGKAAMHRLRPFENVGSQLIARSPTESDIQAAYARLLELMLLVERGLRKTGVR